MKNYRLIDPLNPAAIPHPLTHSQMEARERFLRALSAGIIRVEHVENCLCGGTDFVQVADRDRFGLPFGAFLCTRCGLAVTNPRITEDCLPRYYADFYHDLHFPLAYPDQGYFFKAGQGVKIFEILKAMLPSKKSLRVLDVGAGTGSVAVEFQRKASEAGICAHITVLEYNERIRECLHNQRDLHVVIGGLDLLAESDSRYDVVIMSHVLEHFADPVKQLGRLRHHLDNESLLYVEVPGLFRLKHSCEYNCNFLQYLTSAHMYHFNLASLAYILSLAGFRPIWGNESVETVSRIGSAEIDVGENAAKVKTYLDELEQSLELYQKICDLEARVRMLEHRHGELDAIVAKISRFLPLRTVISFLRSARSSLRTRAKYTIPEVR